jgi:DNA-directed RNA polymerase specialized sigma24 family protein
MRNHWISKGRLKRNRGHCELDEVTLPPVAPTQEDSIRFRETIRELRKISGFQRTMVLLAGVEGMTQVDLAKMFRIPEGTVKSSVSRGRSRLRAVIR